MHDKKNNSIRASKFLQQGNLNEILLVDVKIDEEDKMLILLISLPESYDHIVTIMLYDKETLILKEITLTLLSSKIKKKAKSK